MSEGGKKEGRKKRIKALCFMPQFLSQFIPKICETTHAPIPFSVFLL